MAHLARKQLVSFFGLLAARHIQKYAEHLSIVKRTVIAETAGRYPSNIIANQNPEIDLVSADNASRRPERRADTVAVSRVDMC
jgi:hypothetical protein